eukprot:CAMPEP_0203764062 /NCGR_PEP_ID=MMETSP0098-20131031/17360_1 /ASSEMBLY_ACC=CAM_ASM_000208 /TAXON_ID=96639 /ORGANISM=" , Strain NY0313808BC1" /LENGTH=262 /DNA_ID=CAMNT_0050659693 /DNA_START=336 /DNA_END=1124 /DNA_ORIENTATION=-
MTQKNEPRDSSEAGYQNEGKPFDKSIRNNLVEDMDNLDQCDNVVSSTHRVSEGSISDGLLIPTSGLMTSNVSLTSKDSIWFLDCLESYQMAQLTGDQREALVNSGIRAKRKHRATIIFEDDFSFLFGSQGMLRLDEFTTSIEGCNASCMFILDRAIKLIVSHFRKSIARAPEKGCIWSALLYRVEYLLRTKLELDLDIKISQHDQKRQVEATLCIGDYQITRSNFSKRVRSEVKRTMFAGRSEDIPDPGHATTSSATSSTRQ